MEFKSRYLTPPDQRLGRGEFGRNRAAANRTPGDAFRARSAGSEAGPKSAPERTAAPFPIGVKLVKELQRRQTEVNLYFNGYLQFDDLYLEAVKARRFCDETDYSEANYLARLRSEAWENVHAHFGVAPELLVDEAGQRVQASFDQLETAVTGDDSPLYSGEVSTPDLVRFSRELSRLLTLLIFAVQVVKNSCRLRCTKAVEQLSNHVSSIFERTEEYFGISSSAADETFGRGVDSPASAQALSTAQFETRQDPLRLVPGGFDTTDGGAP